MTRTHLINDCSHYHVGSRVVAEQIRNQMAKWGMIEASADSAELVIVNGEGSLHHDTPNVRRIERAIAATPAAAPVVLINAVWEAQSSNLEAIEMAIARETLSARDMDRTGLAPEIRTIPDIALTFHHRPQYQGRAGLIVLDSVDPITTRHLRSFAEANNGQFIELCEWKDTAEALIDLLATADAVVTGRFHGVVFAILAGAPFIAAPSNTWKTRGMMADFGLGEHYRVTIETIAKAYAAGEFARYDRAQLSAIDEAWDRAFKAIATTTKTRHRESRPAQRKAAATPPQKVWTATKTVVLVGNGPSIRGSRLGRIIDAHDEVVRFNSYALADFEADAGTKTTLWSTTANGKLPQNSPIPRRTICIHEHATPKGEPIEVVTIPREFYQRMTAEIRAISKHQHADKVIPTSGFLVVRFLLESGAPKLNLVGFDHFSKEHSRCHHYWNPKTFGEPTDHDGPAEAALLFPFVKERKIAYLT
jgi:hypothetical protein